jgi:dihydrofolate synthase/folylpolyglutamate synthase
LEVLSEEGYHISRENIQEGLGRASWAGRLHILRRKPFLVVDGAHNPDAAKRLVESLKGCFSYNRSILIMGASADKDVAGVVAELAHFFDTVIVTRSCHPRAIEPIKLKSEFNNYGVYPRVTETVSEAISLASNIAVEEDLICAAGSLFVVAEVINSTGLATDIT